MMNKMEFKNWLQQRTKYSEVNFFENTPCLEWQRSIDGNGYSSATIEQKRYAVHRLVLFFKNNKWPKVTDHRCKNRKCLNELHLKDSTYSENNKNKTIRTHCKRGHKYTTENTILRSDGWRECRACRKANTNLNQPIRRWEKKVSAANVKEVVARFL